MMRVSLDYAELTDDQKRTDRDAMLARSQRDHAIARHRGRLGCCGVCGWPTVADADRGIDADPDRVTVVMDSGSVEYVMCAGCYRTMLDRMLIGGDSGRGDWSTVLYEVASMATAAAADNRDAATAICRKCTTCFDRPPERLCTWTIYHFDPADPFGADGGAA